MEAALKPVGACSHNPKTVTVLGGIEIIYRAVGEDTDGRYSVFEVTVPPGQGPPPHFHTREDESFFVLEGAFDFQIGEQSCTASRGWFGIGLRRIPHAFKAAGTSPAKMLMIVTPGDLSFFDDLAELTAIPPFDFDAVRALFERYGMQIVEPG